MKQRAVKKSISRKRNTSIKEGDTYKGRVGKRVTKADLIAAIVSKNEHIAEKSLNKYTKSQLEQMLISPPSAPNQLDKMLKNELVQKALDINIKKTKSALIKVKKVWPHCTN